MGTIKPLSIVIECDREVKVSIEIKGLSKAKQSPFAAETPILRPV